MKALCPKQKGGEREYFHREYMALPIPYCTFIISCEKLIKPTWQNWIFIKFSMQLTHLKGLPFRISIGIRYCKWRYCMAQNNVGIIKNLLHLHGTITTSSNVISCNSLNLNKASSKPIDYVSSWPALHTSAFNLETLDAWKNFCESENTIFHSIWVTFCNNSSWYQDSK